ncbi:DNA repair protein RAD51 homolog 4 [Octopus bimaculoides]|uniref:RecA family profile 1 domain-containing protein n=1 Tax=Octopus bimaculoides TaxID=37653 RepID=A0A0L8FLN7_OCTBM|nr:DNA repair protein RAD51 homolog 4 [Octopus bimaculoides]|eukprot:XP_014788739.1 PREDICTED: DNA repair protein RAD51 homolog 4-like [Octopus bimaculoides]
MSLIRVGICAGMTEDVVQSLNTANIRNLVEFIDAELEELVHTSGISYKELVALRRVVLAEFSAFPLQASDIYRKLIKSAAILCTGCVRLDQLLDGGLYTGEMTEIVGSSAVGKTQVCLSVAANVAKETKQNILYIDTSASFSAERISEMVAVEDEETEENLKAVLGHIHCAKVFNVFELFEVLETTRQELIKQNSSFFSGLRLIICDSVSAVLSPLVGGHQTQGYSLLVQVAQKLKALALEYSLAVLVTNNIIGSDQSRPVASLGRTWQSVPHNRLHLNRQTAAPSNLGQLVGSITILKSCRQPTGMSTEFEISSSGLQ